MIVGFGFVSSDRYEVVVCLLGLGLSLQGFDWLDRYEVLGFEWKVLIGMIIPGFCWFGFEEFAGVS